MLKNNIGGKIISVLTAGAVIAAGAAASMAVIAADSVKIGDVDGDGKITVSDVVMLRGCIMDSSATDDRTRIAADVDEDGQITVSDVVALRSIIMSGDTSSENTSSGSGTSSGSNETTENSYFTERDLNPSYDESSATLIALNGDSVAISGSGATENNNIITITAKGTYIVSGTLYNGRIIIAADDTKKVQLVLDNAEITCADNAPIYIASGDKVFITLAESSVNTLCDGAVYSLTEDESGIDSVIYSKSDLTLNGTGTLNITGNCNHAVVSKDDLVITGGKYIVNAAGGGFYGKDCVKIADGEFNITSGKDGVQSDNAEDEGRGYIYIEDGSFTINAANDGIQGETGVTVAGGTFNITTGGGSSKTVSSDISAKGIKCAADITISGGEFTVSSADDSVHCNANIIVTGGVFTLSSGDDGIHADTSITIGGGTINILKSYEGIESTTITVNDGEISLVATDDGLNASGGNDSSAVGGRPGQGGFTSSNGSIVINGGIINVNASGDGVDSNGSLSVTGGEVYVSGPTNSGNGALDYDSTATISGGTFIACGSTGMAQNFTSATGQCSLMYNFSSTVSGGTTFTIKDSSGNVLASFTPAKNYQSVVVSCAAMQTGNTYTVTAGSQTASVTLSSSITSNGQSGGGTPGGRPW